MAAQKWLIGYAVDAPEQRDGLRYFWWDEDCGWFGMLAMATRYPSHAAAEREYEARAMHEFRLPVEILPEPPQ